MAEILRCLWDRAQGKYRLRIICNKIFNDYADREKRRLLLNNLHVASLRVYNSVNKQFLSPHMEPPSIIVMDNKIKEYRLKKIEEITREQFYQLIMEWIKKDLHLILASKVTIASLATPALAITTKNIGRQGSWIKSIIEKIPTPFLFSIYFVGLVLLQDVRVD
uniref:Uncharacterized protein LOC105042595 n=1 Tax=Elaeis guineensis var. tenera TaxID=51953 RepID=A0A6I9R5Q2_ELAGV|nr:uncharacterized protein LOC105042595 [Elaeis guineensis]